MRIKAQAASTNITLYGFKYTIQALKKIAKYSIGYPAYYDFTAKNGVIATIVDAKVINDKLIVEAEIFDNCYDPKVYLSVTTGLIDKYSSKDGVIIYEDIDPKGISYGLEYAPMDTTITPIEGLE